MNPWPYVLFSIPFAAVLFGIVMVTTASIYPDDIVADEYYKDGMAINQRLHADDQAKLLGVSANIQTDELGQVRLFVEGAKDSALRLNLRHVTDEDLDQSYVLVAESGAEYSGAELVADAFSTSGVWYLELVGLDEGWRLKQRLTTPLEHSSQLTVSVNE